MSNGSPTGTPQETQAYEAYQTQKYEEGRAKAIQSKREQEAAKQK